MIMLSLPEGDVRVLMNLLLLRETFDDFDLRNVTVQSFARFDIEGVSPQETEPPAEGEEPKPKKPVFCKWKQIRPYVYNIIKGSEKPRFMKIVMSYPQELLTGEYAAAQALFINITFDKNLVHVTTGASMKTFSLNRGVENMWDDYVAGFLKKNNLNATGSE